MQTKKIIGIALCAALVSSMAAISVSARDTMDDGEGKTYFDGDHTLGIVGAFTNWGNADDDGNVTPDIPMTDPDGDGVYVGVVKDIAAGDYQFKIRADGAWEDSWGEYESEYDRTFNSQTDCSITVDDTTDLVVTLDTNGEDGNIWPVTYFTTAAVDASAYGLVGGMTNWGRADDAGTVIPDVAMYEYADGKYVGILKGLEGDQVFKIRKDSAWSADGVMTSWGVYEEDYDRTQDSQTNVTVSLDDASDIVVVFDTTSGDDEDSMAVWPLSYSIISNGVVVDDVYAGKPVVDEPSEESVDEPSEESVDEPSEESVDEPSEESVDEPSEESVDEPSNELPDYYETQIGDYVFFDNSNTKWEKVCAYWWNSDFTKVVDLEGNLYGSVTTNEDGETVQEFASGYPGDEMQQIEGTDIWQIRVPFGATRMIFNSGVSDADVATGVDAYQTVDLDFDAAVNAGQIYTINVDGEVKNGRGIEKTKHKYQEGAWTEYAGAYNMEQIGEIVDPSTVLDEPSEVVDEPSINEPSVDQPSNGGTTGDNGNVDEPSYGGNNTTPNNIDTPKTGDVAMAAVFVAVAATALGAVVLATKKKERE